MRQPKPKVKHTCPSPPAPRRKTESACTWGSTSHPPTTLQTLYEIKSSERARFQRRHVTRWQIWTLRRLGSLARVASSHPERSFKSNQTDMSRNLPPATRVTVDPVTPSPPAEVKPRVLALGQGIKMFSTFFLLPSALTA